MNFVHNTTSLYFMTKYHRISKLCQASNHDAHWWLGLLHFCQIVSNHKYTLLTFWLQCVNLNFTLRLACNTWFTYNIVILSTHTHTYYTISSTLTSIWMIELVRQESVDRSGGICCWAVVWHLGGSGDTLRNINWLTDGRGEARSNPSTHYLGFRFSLHSMRGCHHISNFRVDFKIVNK